jgi:type III secretion protein C
MLGRILVTLALVLGPAPSALAQFSERPFTYVAVGQDVHELLRAFAASEGLGIVISDAVTGTISGSFQQMPPRAFMDEIATTYGLVWYLFGGVLYVYDASETQSEFIYVTNTRPELLRRPLEQLGILDPRFDWRADADLGVILITGPPRYTEMVKQVIQTIEERRADAPGVLVIRLKYASAIDRTISYRDQVITVPGVTSILRELVGLGHGRGVVERTMPATVPALPGLRGQGLAARGVEPTAPAPEATPEAAAPSAADLSQILSDPLGSPAVTIESDPRLNAVIISARGDRLPFFEELVHKLDVPSQLIQIDVTIIDVAANRLTELGVQWDVTSGDFNFGVSSLITSTINAGLGITGMGTDFAAEIRALETVGDARIVSQPSVITFDSVEAVVDETESIYIRVQGNEDVDLFQVQTGTLLRVTPRIVDNEGVRDVELFVDIRDGNFDDSMQVDDIPAVDESTLTTSAIVSEGEGLLLGGLYRTRSEDVDEKVPVLGDIPILGLAFRSKRTQQSSVVRLFLLTPRLVQIGAEEEGRVDLTTPPAGEAERGGTAPAPGRAPTVRRGTGMPWPLVPPGTLEGNRAALPASSGEPCGPWQRTVALDQLTYRSVVQRLGCLPTSAGSPATARPAPALGPARLY